MLSHGRSLRQLDQLEKNEHTVTEPSVQWQSLLPQGDVGSDVHNFLLFVGCHIARNTQIYRNDSRLLLVGRHVRHSFFYQLDHVT